MIWLVYLGWLGLELVWGGLLELLMVFGLEGLLMVLVWEEWDGQLETCGMSFISLDIASMFLVVSVRDFRCSMIEGRDCVGCFLIPYLQDTFWGPRVS